MSLAWRHGGPLFTCVTDDHRGLILSVTQFTSLVFQVIIVRPEPPETLKLGGMVDGSGRCEVRRTDVGEQKTGASAVV